MNYFDKARTAMVKSQVTPSRVTDEALINLLAEVPRHEFVADGFEKVAYFDGRVKISEDRTMLSPEVFARMVQALKINRSSRVLDIAPGRGYSTVILSMLAKEVVAIEQDSSLAHLCANNITKRTLSNVSLKCAPFLKGDPEQAPYDAIIVNGCLNIEPRELLSQLAEDGKLVCIMYEDTNKAAGKAGAIAKAYLYHKHEANITRTELFIAYADEL